MTHTIIIFEVYMNPLLSIKGTIISGFILSAVLVIAIGGTLVDFEHYLRWLHYLESHYTFLFNFIIKEHKKSIKWLKWQKYSFSEQPMLVKQVEMYYFYKHLSG